MFEWLWVVIAYLLGSISTAIIVSRCMGLPDPREGGSGNPGATNVLRLGGKKAAALTLLGDCLKGWVPVFLASLFSSDTLLLAAVGLAAFCGHLFPVFFGFRGGKGVATALGVFIGFSWLVALMVAATWFSIARLFRISSLAALVSSLFAPAYLYWLTDDLNLAIAAILIAVMLVWRHRGNIERLLAGTESRIGR